MAAKTAPATPVSNADLMQFKVGSSGPSWQVGAILVLGAAPGVTVADARRLLAARLQLIPRFRQRLHRPPPGRGRPYWTDDQAFDVQAHISVVPCPPPGDDRALLFLAAECLTTPLPAGRPLWSATFVTGLTRGRTGLIIVMDHVIADGSAALSLLSKLADAPVADTAAPAEAPDDSGTSGTVRARSPRLRTGLAELGGWPPHRIARNSLNRPTGPRRRIDMVTADLAAVREFAHEHGGTVNDVMLAAVAGALRDLLAARGEQLKEVTISAVVSARPRASGGELGNQVGVMPVTAATDGDLGDRVTRIAAITAERKTRARGSSAGLLVPAFLLLARAGLLRPFINHQRLVNSFVTNLRGPDTRLSFGGRPLDAIIPLPVTAGNVTIAFGVLSYAGTLRVTVLCDPARVPDIPRLVVALARELEALPGPRSR